MTFRDNEDREYERFCAKWTDGSECIEARTSGSTGAPKSILLPKSDMVLSARATNSFFGINSESLLVVPLSANYIAGKMMMVRAMEAGCRLWCERASNRPLATSMEGWDDCAIDLVAIVPSQMDGLIASEHFGRVRNVIVGGAPMSEAQERMAAESGATFYATYGMTETCSHVALRRCGEEWYRGLPGVRLTTDERGCLIIEREGVTDPTPVVTNDIVELRNEREFRWVGRADNVIISGGLKVSPEEVERKIGGLIARPFYVGKEGDEKWGERPVLYIEGDGQIDAEGLRTKLKDVLPRHEMPGRIEMVKQIARTENGKIKR